MNDKYFSIAASVVSLIAIVFALPWALWKAWAKIIEQVNGLGTRVDSVELTGVATSAIAKETKEIAILARAERQELQKDVGKLEGSFARMDDHLTELKLDIVSSISGLKDAVSEQNTLVRERLARLEATSKDGG